MVKPVQTRSKTKDTEQTSRLKRKSTVLIVDPHDTRTLSVNTRLLYAIKPLLIVLTFATVLLSAGMLYLSYEYQQRTQQTAQLKQQVTQLQRFTSAEIEAKLSALKASETTVVQLQNYLKSKGVKVDPVDYRTQTHVDTGIAELDSARPSESSKNAAGGPDVNTQDGHSSDHSEASDDAAHSHDHHDHGALDSDVVGRLDIKPSKPIPYVGEFSGQAQALLQKAQDIPLGLPHDGELSSRFGPRKNPFTNRGGEIHGGLDFRGKTGEPIYTTANGVVDFAGVQRGYGNVVIVKHGHGYKTYYAHLSAISVKKGQKVSSGDLVGKLGSTGRSTGPHLHYEVRLNNVRLNPEYFLSVENTQPAA